MEKWYKSLTRVKAGCSFKPTLEMYCSVKGVTSSQLFERSNGISYANLDYIKSGYFNGRYSEKMWDDLMNQDYRHNVLQILREKRDIQKRSGSGRIANITTSLGRRRDPNLGYQGVITAVLYPGKSLQREDFAVEKRRNEERKLVGTTGAAFTFTFDEVEEYVDTMEQIDQLRSEDGRLIGENRKRLIKEFGPFGDIRYEGRGFNLFREFGVNQDNCIVDLIELVEQD